MTEQHIEQILIEKLTDLNTPTVRTYVTVRRWNRTSANTSKP